MMGDGVNDAQADVSIAMGDSGTNIAIETADITLMCDDWNQVPELFLSARKTMRVIQWNFGFTTLYNVLGLSFAAFCRHGTITAGCWHHAKFFPPA